ncbi:Protein of Unknown Function (DUF239) [Quillaja saponaria]|uniref:Neprosin PEP catalytic domain-containing protein n=1 Tax=Quillaja saponaria TaxID=32244 RepID=A0AAD7M272_QUISA|nr:Protein of Unknown Function (DUF239) [Quillaja saponaria]
MKPTAQPKGLEPSKPKNSKSIEIKGTGCPEGTVPILRRKTQEAGDEVGVFDRFHYAMVHMKEQPDNKFYGAGGYINVYNPKASRGDFTKGMIWLQTKDKGPPYINFIQAGTMVHPFFYSDNRTRFFVEWTADHKHATGCFDLACPGFVQVHKSFAPGHICEHISVIEGPQYHYVVLIHQDRTTGNWWLQVGDNHQNIGYWPKALFRSLSMFATEILWGGEVFTHSIVRGFPEMGSGQYVNEGPRRAAYLSVFQVIDESGTRFGPKQDQIDSLVSKAKCYNVSIDEGGQIFDCVDIYKQPALSHPALKNHKIQMRPTSQPKGSERSMPNNSKSIEIKGTGCPEGTVPVLRRKTREAGNEVGVFDRYHYAVVQMKKQPNNNFYGAGGYINVYNPKASRGDFTKGMVWLQTEEKGPPYINFIQAGTMVHPIFYGDNRTRFFTEWTADHKHTTGCFDLACPGFVQVHKSFAPGHICEHISVIEGPQYHYVVLIHQDRTTGNWWLQVADDHQNVGYWPKALFTSLSRSATEVAWGGEAYTRSIVRGFPEMGSGHYVDEGPRRAAYMSVFQVMDESGARFGPKQDQIESFVTKNRCYNVSIVSPDTFLYGGPGGECY